MASYMSNWWKKHDMDKDGKGCCLVATAVLLGAFLAGAIIVGLLLWTIFF